jgi:zinc protease
MPTCRSVPLLILAAALLVPTLPGAIPFPQIQSDLRPDPQARFGTLPNGMRYVIRPNQEPKERASLRLLVEAGAVHESDAQQGLAHFLEHLAFNGSENYPPGTLIEFFQRMGMSFGGDTNASTWFTRTLYLLELPETTPANLTEGFRVFRDYAGGLLLLPEEIEKERGIILSEKRTRDSVGYRTSVATRNFLLAGTLFERRDVIGPTEILLQAGRDQFLDFYDTWYRPELMSLVVVGDIDPVAVEREIVATFTPLQPRGPARPQPDLGRVPSRQGVHVFHHVEPEAPSTNVTIATITPYTREPDTSAVRLKYLPRSLAHAMLNRRLSVLAKQEDAPFTGGSAGAGEGFNFYRQTAITLNCRGDQWADALAVAEQELRRALEHGFEPAELKEVIANYRNSLEQAAKTASTRRSSALADEIARALLERDVFTTPGDDLALFGPALDEITVADCVAAMREAWKPDHRLVLVTGNAVIPSAANEAIAAVFDEARARKVAPPEAVADTPWAYADFGPAGRVVNRQHVADLGITLITFDNGVRLNLKPTGFEANRIRMTVRIGSGQLTEPRDQPGLAFYTGQTFTEGGLGQHSVDDLRRILAGRTVGTGFSASGEAFVINGVTHREDLRLQMQLVAARISDPGYRPEAARQARKAIDQIYLGFAHTASGPFTLEVARLLASGDHRFGLPPKEVMLQRNLDEVKAWVGPDLARGPIEIAVVGDLEIAATIDAVARTLGALPPRGEKPPLDELRRVEFPAKPIAREYAIETEIPKGTVALYWPTTDGLEIHRARRLNMLSEVLNDRLRLKVREELGDAYSPGAGSAASDVYPGYGYIQAGVSIDPPRARQVADIIVEIADELATAGVSEDQLERAKRPVMTSLRESARTNPYWLNSVLSRAQEKPEVLEWSRSRYADNEAITTADINALAREYLAASRASRVIVLPAATSAAAAATPGDRALQDPTGARTLE